MSKYKDADRLMAILVKRCVEANNQEAWFAYAKACGDVRDLPAADVVEVKHGRWEQVGDVTYRCSVCGEVSCCNSLFCGDCGAKMDEVEE